MPAHLGLSRCVARSLLYSVASIYLAEIVGKGKAWESAYEICKDLAAKHAEVTFN